jgi:hypothetical protein
MVVKFLDMKDLDVVSVVCRLFRSLARQEETIRNQVIINHSSSLLTTLKSYDTLGGTTKDPLELKLAISKGGDRTQLMTRLQTRADYLLECFKFSELMASICKRLLSTLTFPLMFTPSSDHAWSSARILHLSQLLIFALQFDAHPMNAFMPNDISLFLRFTEVLFSKICLIVLYILT